MESNIVIIGGGLSGLTCARALKKVNPLLDITILEASDRLGGRIYYEDNIELGAAWSWPINDTDIQLLAYELGLSVVKQYAKGKALYHIHKNKVQVCGYDLSPAGPDAIRFQYSSTFSMIDNIWKELLSDSVKIFYDCKVSKIAIINNKINIFANHDLIFEANYVVIAMPPRTIVKSIIFDPPLPSNKLDIMKSTPTWMSTSGKVGFIYSSRFWVSKEFSGTVFSDKGPLRQIWDNSYFIDNDSITHSTVDKSNDNNNKNNGNKDVNCFVLAGFVFDDDLDYLADVNTINQHILPQLVDKFGEEARNPLHIVYKSWRDDPFIYSDSIFDNENIKSIPFGHELLTQSLDHRIFFAGTETAANEHGHMNGAVIAGLRAADEILSML
eukprot:gene11921-15953_t